MTEPRAFCVLSQMFYHWATSSATSSWIEALSYNFYTLLNYIMLLYQLLLLLHFEKSITCPIDIKAYYNAIVIEII